MVCRGNGSALVQSVTTNTHTKPVDALFTRSLSTFLVKADTGVSGLTQPSLVYQFSATGPGPHGILLGNEILLTDLVASREFYAIVTNVLGDVITVDRPIDHVFPLGSPGFIVSTDMAVDGSVTEVIFTVRAGTIPTDLIRMIIAITDNSMMDSTRFGSLAALTRGLVFRVVSDYQKTVFNFKTNGEIKSMCYDVDYDDRAAPGAYGLFARITFGGEDKHGLEFRISNEDVLQWVIQDDLTALSTMRISAQGHDSR